jgi:hypothetical protein
MQTPSAKCWGSISKAAEKLSVSRDAIRKLIESGLLTTRQVPGTYAKIWMPDVDRLAARSIRRARPA